MINQETMTIKYQKITLGDADGTEIFVRVKDFQRMRRAIQNKKPDEAVKASIQLLLGSPEGFDKMHESITAVHYVMKCKNRSLLENMRDMINYELKMLKTPKKKSASSKEGAK